MKQLLEDKNDAMCVVLLRLVKTKDFNMVPSFCQHWHLTWQKWGKFFQAGYFGLWTDENVRRTFHQCGFLQVNGNALQQVETFKCFGVVFKSDETKGLIHELVEKAQFCVSLVPPGWRNGSFQRTQNFQF